MEAIRADRRLGRPLVAVDADDRAVGFALFDLHEDEAHLREVDGVPEHGSRGLGRRLIQAVITKVQEAGRRRLARTTFLNVPFDALFYVPGLVKVWNPSGGVFERMRSW